MSWWTASWRARVLMLALLACNPNAFGDDHAPAVSAAGSLSDAKGCKFVDPHPLSEETVTWTGACVNGWAEGEGRVQWFSKGQSGEQYIGALVRGSYDGQGKLIRADGAEFEGHFVRGLLQGVAKARWPNGDRFEGSFVDGQRSGRGVQQSAKGARYEGEFARDQYDGDGLMKWPDGSSYEGHFAQGRRDGHGIERRADGAVFEGQFLSGMPIGKGVVRTPDGRRREVEATNVVASAVEVCPVMKTVEMPRLEQWTGDAAYAAEFAIKAGRVVSINMKIRRSAGSEDADSILEKAIVTALTSSVCTGDRVASQDYEFHRR